MCVYYIYIYNHIHTAWFRWSPEFVNMFSTSLPATDSLADLVKAFWASHFWFGLFGVFHWKTLPDRFKELSDPEFILLHVFHVVQPIPFIQEWQEAGGLGRPEGGTERDTQQLTDRCIRWCQQGTALHRGLLLSTLFTKFWHKDMLEILVIPNEIFQRHQSSASDGHLEQLHVEFNPKCIGGIHSFDAWWAWWAVFDLLTLGILVWSWLAENSEATFILRAVTNTDPLEVCGFRSTVITSLPGSPLFTPIKIAQIQSNTYKYAYANVCKELGGLVLKTRDKFQSFKTVPERMQSRHIKTSNPVLKVDDDNSSALN